MATDPNVATGDQSYYAVLTRFVSMNPGENHSVDIGIVRCTEIDPRLIPLMDSISDPECAVKSGNSGAVDDLSVS